MDFFKTLINSIKHWVNNRLNDQLNALENKIDSELEQKQTKGDYALKTDVPEHTWESLPDKPFSESDILSPIYFYDNGNSHKQLTFLPSFEQYPGYSYRYNCDMQGILEPYTDYVVEFDGVRYNCRSFYTMGMNDDDEEVITQVYVGNGALSNRDEYEDDGMPFLLNYDHEERIFMIYIKTNDTHTIQLFKHDGVRVDTIDPKYLPEHEHSWNNLTDKPFGESEAIEITWDGNLDSIETKVVISEDIINETNYSKHYLCYVSDKVPSNEELIGNTFAYTGGNIVDQAFVEPYVDKMLISDRGSTLTEDIANMGWEVYVVRKDNLEYVAYDTPIVFPKAGIYFNYVVDSGSNYGRFSYASALTIPSEVSHLDEKYIPNTVARVSDINWDNLDGKPFGTMYADTVTWDGNTDGLLTVNFNGKSLYKVCDEPAIETVLANGFVWNMDGVDNSVSAAEANDFYEMTGIVAEANLNIFIIPEDNCTAGNVTFPEKGIYFYKQNETSYCNCLTISGYKKFPVGFATIDPQYLPKHEHSWNDLTDKPFDGGEVNTIEITWDGDTSGKLSFDEVPPFGLTVYRVSDLVVSKNDLEGAIFIHGQADDDLHEFVMSSNFVIEGNGYLYDEYGFIHVINDGSDESGIYFASDMGRAYGRVYSMSFTATTPVKTIDPKYLPDISETVDTAVTAALTEAKESGEFDGAPGADGKTPVKGTDYYTEADKAEMVNRVIAALPTWTGGSY